MVSKFVRIAIAFIALALLGTACSPPAFGQGKNAEPAQPRPTPNAGVAQPQGTQTGMPPAGQPAKAPSSGEVKDDGDKAIDAAISRVQEIDQRLARFANAIEETAKLVREMNDLKTDAKTRDAVRLRLRQFKAIADEFGTVKRDIKVIGPSLKDSLGKAPLEFRRACDEYERKAKAEKFPAHQEKYREMAKHARKDGEEYQNDSDTFDGKVQLVLELIEFAEANGRLARDMEKHLDLHRDPAKGQYLDRLITVIAIQQKQFDALYRIWREYLDRRRGAIQDGQPAPYPPEVPGVPAPDGRPTLTPKVGSAGRHGETGVVISIGPPGNARQYVLVRVDRVPDSPGELLITSPRGVVQGRMRTVAHIAEGIFGGYAEIIALAEGERVMLRGSPANAVAHSGRRAAVRMAP